MKVGGYGAVYGSKNNVKSRIDEANSLWQKGLDSLTEGKRREAEITMRDSLKNLRDAYHLSAENVDLGRLLHEKGRIIHDTYGCNLRMAGETYYVECPVMLSHVKLGFSVGGSAEAICNICGRDPWDCDHVKGYKYNGVHALKIGNTCNICLQENCEHRESDIFDNVEAVHIITKMRIEEVSLVQNPANPLARIHMYTLGPDDIRESLPDSEKTEFIPGKTIVHCHHCIECGDSRA